VICALNFVNL